MHLKPEAFKPEQAKDFRVGTARTANPKIGMIALIL
jgi:hypothetical protein